MINLLLMVLMIAALLGMVFCNRQQRKSTKFQLLALSLLVIVIASGGIFMCRLGTPAVLGLNEADDPAGENDKKLRAAQGYVVTNFIRNKFPDKKQILLIIPESLSHRSVTFIDELRNGNPGNLRIEAVRQNTGDKLITPAADNRSETRSINAAIARHSDAEIIILYGLAPSGNSIRYLDIYEQPFNKRAKIIVLGLANLNDWAARQLREGFFEAMVITDLTRISRSKEKLPDNLVEVFDSRYVLVTRDNLNRNRRYFH